MSIPSTALSKYEKPHARLGARSPRGPPCDPLAVTLNEACRLSGLGRTKIYELVDAKQLKLIKVGRRSLIVFKSLRELIEGEVKGKTTKT